MLFTEYAVLRIEIDTKLEFTDTPKLRGFFGREFQNRSEFHQHGPDGNLIYQHPLIQYKIIRSQAYLCGLGDGALLVSALNVPDHLSIGSWKVKVISSNLKRESLTMTTRKDYSYQFVTPWIALNQINYQGFAQAESQTEKENLLGRILVGNLLSLSKAIGYDVIDRLVVNVILESAKLVYQKGTRFLGIAGKFSCNFFIPPLWGIGKMTSRGFGVVEPWKN